MRSVCSVVRPARRLAGPPGPGVYNSGRAWRGGGGARLNGPGVSSERTHAHQTHRGRRADAGGGPVTGLPGHLSDTGWEAPTTPDCHTPLCTSRFVYKSSRPRGGRPPSLSEHSFTSQTQGAGSKHRHGD